MKTSRLLTGIGFVLALAIPLGLRVHSAHTSNNAVAGVDCTSDSDTRVITFFYVPGTSPTQLGQLIHTIGGSQVDAYATTHGYSVSVPTYQTAKAVRLLKSQPSITQVSVSPAEGCLDPD